MMDKRSKILTFVGIGLLIIMAGFHLSGISYVTSEMNESDAKEFLKSIFGVLFVHPSLQLILLAVLGLLSLSMGKQAGKIQVFISASILIDAVLAFYLGAVPPGLMLLIAAAAFGLAGILVLQVDNATTNHRQKK